MAAKKYIPKSKHDSGKHLAMQFLMMHKHYRCFKCSLQHRVLTCIGEITPSEGCDTYKVQIRLPLGMTPRVKILDPKIEFHPKIHMYPSKNLCLYKPNDQPWMEKDFIHEKIVPWTAEWLVYYELFKLTGEWHGPEAPHGEESKEQQKKAS